MFVLEAVPFGLPFGRCQNVIVSEDLFVTVTLVQACNLPVVAADSPLKAFKNLISVNAILLVSKLPASKPPMAERLNNTPYWVGIELSIVENARIDIIVVKGGVISVCGATGTSAPRIANVTLVVES